jgi:hypothetical protein
MAHNARPMAPSQPATPPLSPDGNYWWDGQAWQPMPFPGAHPAPAQVAQAASVAVNQPAWLDQPVAPAAEAMPNQIPEPALIQEPVVQLWNTPAPRGRSRTWIYVTGGLLIAVMAVTALYVGSQLRSYSQNAAVVVSPSPSPIISDYERADRFLNVDVTPPLAEVNDAVPAVNKNCTTKLPPSCKDALIVMNRAMVGVDDAIAKNQADIPVCIARPVQQFQFDWRGMEQGVSQAIAGFTANSRALIISGLVKYGEIAKYLQPDVDRISKALTTCPKTV